MAAKSPWSVKGVSREDREQAKTAARRAGVPVGVWLSQQIRSAGPSADQAEADVVTKDGDAARSERPRGAPPRGGPDSRFSFGPGQWSTATDAVDTGQVSQAPPQPLLSGRPPAMPAAPPQQMPAPTAQQMGPPISAAGPQQAPPIATHWGMLPLTHPLYMPQPQPMPPTGPPPVDPEALKALEHQIESLQKELAAADARTSAELETIGRRMEKVDGLARDVDALRSSQDDDDAPNYSTAPVERAVMRLFERLQRVEEILAPEASGGSFFARFFRRG